jgi:hypothetical protein
VVRLLASLAALFVAFAAGAAEAPAPGGVPDVEGARSLGVGASIALTSGNDGLYVNPAVIAAERRYAVDAGTLVDRRGASNVAVLFGGSVVDSLSGPVAAGFSYLRAQSGDYRGNLVHLALAGPLAEQLFLGATVKWLSVTELEKVSAATVDAGLLWRLGRMLSLGATGYNLVGISNPRVAPRMFGAGLAVGTAPSLQVSGDWRTDLDRLDRRTNRYAVGVEFLLGGVAPLRAGFVRDETIGARWWSIGTGLVVRGFAVDVGYRQDLDAASARTIAVQVKTFLFG